VQKLTHDARIISIRFGLRCGAYITRCPICGDAVLMDEEDDRAILRCQFCAAEVGCAWDADGDAAEELYLEFVEMEVLKCEMPSVWQ
jgi:uncharacterized protein (DUF983 family)